MENPASTLLELSLSYAMPRCLHMIAELGVADALGDEPRTVADLAASTGVNVGVLASALRLLSSHGVFESVGKGYVHTPVSRLLRTDHPQSMRSWVRWSGSAICWKSIEMLGHSMRTGEPSAEQVATGGTWTYLAQHPEVGGVFDEAMTAKAHGQVAGILSSYDFSRFGTIADIGGGRGHLLQAVLGAAPNASGVLFDQPYVVEQLGGTASARFKLQGGDFFKDRLPVCDAYMIMQVIHDWNDAQSVEILSAIRRVAPAYAKLLVIEAIIPGDSNPSWIKEMDIFMMALFASKERTRREFEDLLTASGFRLDRVIDVGLGTSILEASVI